MATEFNPATYSVSSPPVHTHSGANFPIQEVSLQVHHTHFRCPILGLISTEYLFPALSTWSIDSNVLQGTTTPISSFESGWSNLPAEGGFVSIEQYRTLQARFNEIHRENSNLVKEHIRLEAKNAVLKYVLSQKFIKPH